MKHVKIFLVSAVLAAAMSACGGGNKTTTPETGVDEATTTAQPESDGNTMTLITGNDELRFSLSGTGTATIVWGNKKETVALSEDESTSFVIDIPDINSRTVTISGENMTSFGCVWGGLTAFDVSRNTALKMLYLKVNQLTGLDLSKNSALTYVDIIANSFSAAALDDLFGTLHGKGGTINIAYNPGTDDCNKSIAEAKGWTVEVVEAEEY